MAPFQSLAKVPVSCKAGMERAKLDGDGDGDGVLDKDDVGSSMGIVGAEYLGDVAAPTAEMGSMHGDVGSGHDLVQSRLQNRQMSEELAEVMQARAHSDDSALIHSQMLDLYTRCEDGTVTKPTYIGDYVPVIKGDASQGAVVVSKPGKYYVDGDVLVTQPDGTTALSRVGCGSGKGVRVTGLGPRANIATDGDSALVESTDPKVTDIVHDFQSCCADTPASMQVIEDCLLQKYGARAADIGPDAFARLLSAVQALRSTPSYAPSTPSTDRFGVIRGQSTPSLSLEIDLEIDTIKVLVQSATARLAQFSEDFKHGHRDTVVESYRKIGVLTAKAALQRASNWQLPDKRGVHSRVWDIASETLSASETANQIVSESDMDIISAHRAEFGGDDIYATESIEEDMTGSDLPDSETLTPSARLALLACTELFQRLGFALDASAVRRSSDAALIDCLADEVSFEARVETHRQRLQMAGKQEVDADIVARDVCARNLIRDSPENMIVFSAFHLMSTMVSCTADTGRLCISKLNHFHRDKFSTKKPFSSESPSIVAYVANVAHTVKTFGDVHIRWRQSTAQVAEKLAFISKTKKLGRSAIIPKLRNLRMAEISPLLVPAMPFELTSDNHALNAHVQCIQGAYPPTGASTYETHRTRLAHDLHPPKFEVLQLVRKDVRNETEELPAADLPRGAMQLIATRDGAAHIQHIVAPVSIVLMCSEPLPPWAASLLRRDRGLARLVEAARKDFQSNKTIRSPMSLGGHGSVTQFLSHGIAVSAAFVDMIRILAGNLAPIAAPEIRLRMRPLKFGKVSSTSGQLERSHVKSDAEMMWGDLEEEFDMFADDIGEL